MDAAGIHVHPSTGFITVEAPVARAGVLPYYDPRYPDEQRIDYKPIEELTKDSFLSSLGGLPVVRLHPQVDFVTSDNWQDHDLIGLAHTDVSLAGRRQEDEIFSDGFVRLKYTIFDASAIAQAQAGELAQSSLGAVCDRIYTPGTLENGVSYDAIQTNLLNNHLAMVPLARAGGATDISAQLRGMVRDSQDARPILINIGGSKLNPTGNTMPTDIKSNPGEAAKDAAEADQLKSLVADNAQLKTENEALTTQMGEMVTVEDARALARQAVAFVTAARTLGQEVSLDAYFADPAGESNKVVTAVSGQDRAFDASNALVYLEARAETVKAAPATQDGVNALDAATKRPKETAKDSKQASNRVADARAAARKKLLGN